MDIVPKPPMGLMASTLLEPVTGIPPGERSRFVLTGMLLDHVAGQSLLLVVDEAQRLNRECIEYLRHLHDHPTASFARSWSSEATAAGRCCPENLDGKTGDDQQRCDARSSLAAIEE